MGALTHRATVAIIGAVTDRRGSAGNVIAALASVFIPGLGQLVQGRILAAILFFLGAGLVWTISFGTMGWIVHIWSCIDAAVWKPRH